MLSGKGGVRWLCPQCENEDIIAAGKYFECPACSHYFTANARISLGKRSKIVTVRKFVADMLDKGLERVKLAKERNFSHYLEAAWNNSPTFDLYMRAGLRHSHGAVKLAAVVANVTSRNKGAGNYKRLLKYIEEQALEKGYEEVVIENPNPEHKGLYEKYGYVSVWDEYSFSNQKVLSECTKDITVKEDYSVFK